VLLILAIRQHCSKNTISFRYQDRHMKMDNIDIGAWPYNRVRVPREVVLPLRVGYDDNLDVFQPLP